MHVGSSQPYLLNLPTDVKSSYLLKMLFPYEEPHAYIYIHEVLHIGRAF